MGDKSICDIIGIEIVNIKMLDGVVHILSGVAYIPKLRRNLISIDQLYSMGYIYSVASEPMKITYGNLVLMKGEKFNDLYHLIRSAIIDCIPFDLDEELKAKCMQEQVLM